MQHASIEPSSTPSIVMRSPIHVRFVLKPQLLTQAYPLPSEGVLCPTCSLIVSPLSWRRGLERVVVHLEDSGGG
jgi:hypothetical protein